MKKSVTQVSVGGALPSRLSALAGVAVLLLTLRISVEAQPTWLQLSTPTTHPLRKVCFVDSLNGWVGGDSGTILRTTNGGRNWETQNSTISGSITGLSMAKNGWGWALSIAQPESPGDWYGTTLLKTSDGGETWTGRTFDSVFYYSIALLDSSTGWMGGDLGSLRGTTDGGATWFDANVTLGFYSRQPLRCIRFYSRSTGFVSDGMPDIAGAVWRTTDAGQHWTTTALRDQLLDIGISDSLNIICIGGGYDEGAEIARTTDGGDTWQFSVLGFPRFYGQALAIAFRTPSEGWSVLGSAGAAMTTSDSGNTWSLATIKKSVNFFDIAFTDERHGYVVGANGLVLSYNAPALIAVKQNWNLVSVPSAVADRRKSTLFPTATSQAFAFTPAGYEQKDTLTGEAGYWIKFPADEIVAVPGVPVYSDTVGVIAGWNIVGSVSAPIPAAAIRGVGTTIISPFYGYDGGYAVADSLLPGRGYWVKVMAAGELILSADAAGAINPHAEIHRK